jgi:hypothetical protein
VSALAGIDRYRISKRRVAAEADGQFVILTVEGSDGDGEVMLTPEQALAVAKLIREAAENVVIGYVE